MVSGSTDLFIGRWLLAGDIMVLVTANILAAVWMVPAANVVWVFWR